MQQNGRHVRRLLLEHVSGLHFYLSCFPNLNDLALWDIGYDGPSMALIDALHLKRFSCNLRHLFTSIDSFKKWACDGKQTFANLTHLDIIGVADSWTWAGLGYLPRLTHLMVLDTLKDIAIQPILDECRSLQVLLIMTEKKGTMGATPVFEVLPERSEDLRIVRCVANFVEHWKAGIRGGHDVYMVGEEVVSERLRKAKLVVMG